MKIDNYSPLLPPIKCILVVDYSYCDTKVIKEKILKEVPDVNIKTLENLLCVYIESNFYSIEYQYYPLLYYNPICSKDIVSYSGLYNRNLHPKDCTIELIISPLVVENKNRLIEILEEDLVPYIDASVHNILAYSGVDFTNKCLSVPYTNALDGFVYLHVMDDIRIIRYMNAMYYKNMEDGNV